MWARVLKVRGLVVSVQEDTEMWIKFANLARKCNRVPLAYKTLASVYGQDPERPRDPVRQGPPCRCLPDRSRDADGRGVNVHVRWTKKNQRPQTLIYRFPRVTYTYLKYLWSAGNRRDAFQRLITFTGALGEQEVRELSSACTQKRMGS